MSKEPPRDPDRECRERVLGGHRRCDQAEYTHTIYVKQQALWLFHMVDKNLRRDVVSLSYKLPATSTNGQIRTNDVGLEPWIGKTQNT